MLLNRAPGRTSWALLPVDVDIATRFECGVDNGHAMRDRLGVTDGLLEAVVVGGWFAGPRMVSVGHDVENVVATSSVLLVHDNSPGRENGIPAELQGIELADQLSPLKLGASVSY